MLRIALPTILALCITGCSKAEEDKEDTGGLSSWASGGASDLPGWGSGSSGGGGSSGGSSDGGGATGGGSTSGGDGSTSGGGGSTSGGGGSTTGGGGSTTGGGGSTTGGGSSGGDGESARDYAGGYPTNRCATTPSPTGTNIGDISPDWELTDQYGESVRLSDFCGSLVLLESAGFS